MNKNALFFHLTLLISLLFVALFPTHNLFQEVAVILVFFVLLPSGFVLFVCKNSLFSYGMRFSLKITDILFALLVYGLATGGYLLLQYYEIFPRTLAVLNDFLIFLTFHVLLTGLVIFSLEFFFRGFIQSHWRNHLGIWSVLAQWGLFALFLIITGSFSSPDMLPFLYIAPFAGLVAYKTRSILLTFIFSWVFVILSYSIGPF